MRIVTIILLALLVQYPVLAAENNTESTNEVVGYQQSYYTPDSESTANKESSLETLKRIDNEFWYIILLCLLCVISLLIVLSFLKQQKHTAKDIVNATGLTLIIFGTIILVLIVDTSEQLTAAIGILGAIAGYLFRSVQNHEEPENIG
jgi:prepilin signal peptidase PulO-like enzyme (type II secretory pathway)